MQLIKFHQHHSKEFEKYDVPYEYIAFPKSNHGMYNDLDKTQEFMDKTLKYCEYYLKK